ncbi:unnamed protein product [Amoebophrya sp. A25]|nr:unnamed protein product [Amoebophrya sp. A25]|eukprot:GSA25T00018358001.1
MLVCLWVTGFVLASVLVRYAPRCCSGCVEMLRKRWFWLFFWTQVFFLVREWIIISLLSESGWTILLMASHVAMAFVALVTFAELWQLSHLRKYSPTAIDQILDMVLLPSNYGLLMAHTVRILGEIGIGSLLDDYLRDKSSGSSSGSALSAGAGVGSGGGDAVAGGPPNDVSASPPNFMMFNPFVPQHGTSNNGSLYHAGMPLYTYGGSSSSTASTYSLPTGPHQYVPQNDHYFYNSEWHQGRRQYMHDLRQHWLGGDESTVSSSAAGGHGLYYGGSGTSPSVGGTSTSSSSSSSPSFLTQIASTVLNSFLFQDSFVYYTNHFNNRPPPSSSFPSFPTTATPQSWNANSLNNAWSATSFGGVPDDYFGLYQDRGPVVSDHVVLQRNEEINTARLAVADMTIQTADIWEAWALWSVLKMFTTIVDNVAKAAARRNAQQLEAMKNSRTKTGQERSGGDEHWTISNTDQGGFSGGEADVSARTTQRDRLRGDGSGGGNLQRPLLDSNRNSPNTEDEADFGTGNKGSKDSTAGGASSSTGDTNAGAPGGFFARLFGRRAADDGGTTTGSAPGTANRIEGDNRTGGPTGVAAVLPNPSLADRAVTSFQRFCLAVLQLYVLFSMLSNILEVMVKGILGIHFPTLCPYILQTCEYSCITFWDDNVGPYQALIISLLCTAAIYCVFVFEGAFHGELSLLDPYWKFFGVKGVVSVTWTQWLVIRYAIFGFYLQFEAYYFYAFLCVMEIPILTIIHAFFAYPVNNIYLSVSPEAAKKFLLEQSQAMQRAEGKAPPGPRKSSRPRNNYLRAAGGGSRIGVPASTGGAFVGATFLTKSATTSGSPSEMLPSPYGHLEIENMAPAAGARNSIGGVLPAYPPAELGNYVVAGSNLSLAQPSSSGSAGNNNRPNGSAVGGLGGGTYDGGGTADEGGYYYYGADPYGESGISARGDEDADASRPVVPLRQYVYQTVMSRPEEDIRAAPNKKIVFATDSWIRYLIETSTPLSNRPGGSSTVRLRKRGLSFVRPPDRATTRTFNAFDVGGNNLSARQRSGSIPRRSGAPGPRQVVPQLALAGVTSLPADTAAILSSASSGKGGSGSEEVMSEFIYQQGQGGPCSTTSGGAGVSKGSSSSTSGVNKPFVVSPRTNMVGPIIMDAGSSSAVSSDEEEEEKGDSHVVVKNRLASGIEDETSCLGRVASSIIGGVVCAPCRCIRRRVPCLGGGADDSTGTSGEQATHSASSSATSLNKSGGPSLAGQTPSFTSARGGAIVGESASSSFPGGGGGTDRDSTFPTPAAAGGRLVPAGGKSTPGLGANLLSSARMRSDSNGLVSSAGGEQNTTSAAVDTTTCYERVVTARRLRNCRKCIKRTIIFLAVMFVSLLFMLWSLKADNRQDVGTVFWYTVNCVGSFPTLPHTSILGHEQSAICSRTPLACHVGYRGQPSVTCDPSLAFRVEGTCTVVGCGAPPRIPNASPIYKVSSDDNGNNGIHSGDHQLTRLQDGYNSLNDKFVWNAGEIVHYTCNPGYTGSVQARCSPSGAFSIEGSCELVGCGVHPPQLEHAKAIAGGNRHGHSRPKGDHDHDDLQGTGHQIATSVAAQLPTPASPPIWQFPQVVIAQDEKVVEESNLESNLVEDKKETWSSSSNDVVNEQEKEPVEIQIDQRTKDQTSTSSPSRSQDVRDEKTSSGATASTSSSSAEDASSRAASAGDDIPSKGKMHGHSDSSPDGDKRKKDTSRENDDSFTSSTGTSSSSTKDVDYKEGSPVTNGTVTLKKSYAGERIVFECENGYTGAPVAECRNDGHWITTDQCKLFTTTLGCHCLPQWISCDDSLLGTDCYLNYGCKHAGASYQWCRVDPASCPLESAVSFLSFNLFPGWDYCVDTEERPNDENNRKSVDSIGIDPLRAAADAVPHEGFLLVVPALVLMAVLLIGCFFYGASRNHESIRGSVGVFGFGGDRDGFSALSSPLLDGRDTLDGSALSSPGESASPAGHMSVLLQHPRELGESSEKLQGLEQTQKAPTAYGGRIEQHRVRSPAPVRSRVWSLFSPWSNDDSPETSRQIAERILLPPPSSNAAVQGVVDLAEPAPQHLQQMQQQLFPPQSSRRVDEEEQHTPPNHYQRDQQDAEDQVDNIDALLRKQQQDYDRNILQQAQRLQNAYEQFDMEAWDRQHLPEELDPQHHRSRDEHPPSSSQAPRSVIVPATSPSRSIPSRSPDGRARPVVDQALIASALQQDFEYDRHLLGEPPARSVDAREPKVVSSAVTSGGGVFDGDEDYSAVGYGFHEPPSRSYLPPSSATEAQLDKEADEVDHLQVEEPLSATAKRLGGVAEGNAMEIGEQQEDEVNNSIAARVAAAPSASATTRLNEQRKQHPHDSFSSSMPLPDVLGELPPGPGTVSAGLLDVKSSPPPPGEREYTGDVETSSPHTKKSSSPPPPRIPITPPPVVGRVSAGAPRIVEIQNEENTTTPRASISSSPTTTAVFSLERKEKPSVLSATRGTSALKKSAENSTSKSSSKKSGEESPQQDRATSSRALSATSSRGLSSQSSMGSSGGVSAKGGGEIKKNLGRINSFGNQPPRSGVANSSVGKGSRTEEATETTGTQGSTSGKKGSGMKGRKR